MEPYELDKDKIILWAQGYATYQELEDCAKAIYAIYVMQRKKDHPNEQRKAKAIKHKLIDQRLGQANACTPKQTHQPAPSDP